MAVQDYYSKLDVVSKLDVPLIIRRKILMTSTLILVVRIKLSTKSVVRSGMAGKTMIRIILNWMRSPMAWSWIIYLRILPITVGIMMTQRAM